ncbi:hypothetical protein [Actinosynnema sp. NPDC020468]|uniref:hypothetical protein n=1 Tax=Actinosynnema sp. NPDC020468 TaxID=3154488 RepID=UPI0033ED4182
MTGPDLWSVLDDARSREHGPERTAALADVVRLADSEDLVRAGFHARRALAGAHAADGRWHEVCDLFRDSLASFDRQPWRFARADEDDMLEWYGRQVGVLPGFPWIPTEEVTRALADAERRFHAAGRDVSALHAARRTLAAQAGDRDAEQDAHRRWLATAAEDEGWRRAVEVERALWRGEALPDVRAELADPTTGDHPTNLVRLRMLLPLAASGRVELAASTWRRFHRGAARREHTAEDLALLLEFCALTGNEDTAVGLLDQLRGFEERLRPSAVLEVATAVALLTERLVRQRRGSVPLDVGHGPEPCRAVAYRARNLAQDLAKRFDERNGTCHRSNGLRRRLAREPVVAFLPLAPTARPSVWPVFPARLANRDLLDLAERHDRRSEPEEAKAALFAVDEDALTDAERHRLDELDAWLYQDVDVEERLRRAASGHLEHGAHGRYLTARCRLGLWIIHSGHPAEGLDTTSRAVAGLRTLGDDHATAWGEYWLAVASERRNRVGAALRAVARGTTRARACGDPLALGVLHALAAALHDEPTASIASARSALDSFLLAGAPERALEALALLESAHEQAGLDFRPVVAEVLESLPERGVERVRGFLLLHRAESLADLVEGVGQAARRGDDTVDHWLVLAEACQEAGRHEDGIDAGSRAAAAADRAGDLTSADRARQVVAECYRAIGDLRAAVQEYRRLADGSGPLAAAAFVAGAELLAELG